MAEWSKNNLACRRTWGTLRILDQNKKVFKDSGTIKMKALTFWSALDDAAMSALKARSLAVQLHNFFTEVRGAKLEQGITKVKAVKKTAAVLGQAEKTMADLAESLDASYLFVGEDPDDV